MRDKLAIMVCDDLSREAETALAHNCFEEVRLVTFPSECIRPRATWEKITSRIAPFKGEFSRIDIIASGGCVPQGNPPASLGPCHVHRLEQPAHLFLDSRTAEAYVTDGAYLLTPGWLARWRQYLTEWGFDQSTAGEFFREFATRLVLLDTGVDETSAGLLKEFADFLGLPYESVPVGLDAFRLQLENIVLKWRLEVRETSHEAPSGNANRPVADYAMAFDLIDGLAGITKEPEAIERVLELFTMLFAPAVLAYLPLDNGGPGSVIWRPAPVPEAEAFRESLAGLADEYAWTESGHGFLLLITHHGERLGVVGVDGVAFPEYREHYLNLALTVGRLCGLAVSNARTYEQMKQAEEALDAQRERLAVTLRSIGDGLIATDMEGRVVLLNQVAEVLTGWAHEKAAGKPLSEVFHIINDGTRQPVEDPVKRVLKTGAVAGLANGTVLISKDGTERAIADSAAPVVDKHGRTVGVVLVFRDVTQRLTEAIERSRLYEAEHAARAEAEAARRQTSDILESITDAFFALDSEWRITYLNKAAEPLLHKAREELLGRILWEEFPEAVGSTFYNEYHRAVAKQVAVRFEEFYPPFDAWFEVHAFPSRTGLSVYFQDINARKKSEEELGKLSRAVEQSPSTVVITDLAGNIEYANPKFTQTTGYTLQEAIGQNPRMLKSGEMSADGYQELWKTISAGGEWRGELHNKRKNGELYWEFASISPIRDSSGNITHFLAVKEDISARKQAEESVRQLNESLERRALELNAINKELEAFSYSVSHDLRAPLRSIDGFSLALLEDYGEKLDDEAKSHLDRIRAASQRMALLIDDLLMLSRLTRKEMRSGSVDLSLLAEEVAQELRRSDPTRRVEFIIQPGIVSRGDRDLLRVVMDNLLRNAWKFTSTRPLPMIEFGATEIQAKTAYFVRDNGAGFDMAYAGKLFGAFQRLHAATEFPGTGIGLATVQRIIHRHGGRVWAEGAPDQGATFYFTLA